MLKKSKKTEKTSVAKPKPTTSLKPAAPTPPATPLVFKKVARTETKSSAALGAKPASSLPKKAHPPAQARTPSPPKPPLTIDVSFILEAPDASFVCVCGGFNDWEPGASAMIQQSAGRWETKLALPPGRYEYKFVVDGEWIADPEARFFVQNEHGSRNSVIEVAI